MWPLLRRAIFPINLRELIGRLLAIMAFFKLITGALGRGVHAVFDALLKAYDAFVGFFLGPLEPPLEQLLQWAGSWLNFAQLDLQPHWKHIFVLMGAYIFRQAEVCYSAGFKRSAIFTSIWGFFVALFASAISGIIPTQQDDFVSQFMIVAIPVIGLFVFDAVDSVFDLLFFYRRDYGRIGRARRDHLGSNVVLGFARPVAGLVIAFVALQLSIVRQLPSAGLAVFAVLTFLLALFWLWRGARVVSRFRKPNEPWITAYLQTGAAGVGCSILGVFFWVLVVLLFNEVAGAISG